MAFTADDMTEVYSNRTIIEIKENALFYNLGDRSWEPDVQTNYEVHIPVPSWTAQDGVAGQPYDPATGAIGTRQTPSQAFVTMAMDQSRQWNGTIPRVQGIELPLNYVERYRRRFSDNARLWYEQNLYQYLDGLTYDADHTIDGGDSTNFIAHDTGLASTDAGRALPLAAIREFAAAMGEKGAMTGIGDRPNLVCAMPVRMFHVLADDLLEKGLLLQPLNESILRGPQVFSSEVLRGELYGVTIVTPTIMKAPPDNTTDWEMLMFTSGSYACAIRPPFTSYASPSQNQSGDAHLIDSVTQGARVQLSADHMYKATISSGS